MKDTHDTHTDDVVVEPIRMADGRYGERRVRNRVDSIPCSDQYEAETVTEVWEEDRPLHLKERIREIKKPMVVERVVETIEGDEVVEKRVEALDNGRHSLRLVDHIGVARSATAAVNVDAQDCDCVSREELEDHMTTLIDGLKEAIASRVEDDDDYYYEEPEPRQAVAPVVRAQQVVEETKEEENKWGLVEWILLGVVGIEAAYLVMNILPQYLNRF